MHPPIFWIFNGTVHITRMSTKGLALKLGLVNSSKIPAGTISFHLELQQRSAVVVPDGSRIGVQKAWDTPLVSRKLEEVLSAALHHTPVIFCTRFLVQESVRDLMAPPFVSPFHCVSGPPCVHRTRAFAVPKSTASVFTALPVANPPVVICDITPSMILSNGPWRQPTSLPCWSQNRYQEMMETSWRTHCAAMGERSLLSLGFHVSRHPGSQSLEPCVRQSWNSG